MAEKSSGSTLNEAQDGRKPDFARRRLWRRRFIACGVSSTLSILGAICFLQYRAHNTVYIRSPNRESGIELLYDPLLGWRNIPNFKSTTFGKKLTINSLGLRDREHSVEKPPGVFRVLVLGDSFAWGYGVADDEVFPHVLEAKLSRSHPSWEVINTGVSGWGTDQEYLYLTHEGFAYSPDLVVLAVFTANDPLDNSRSKPYQRFKPVFLNTDLELANVPVPKPSVRKKEIRTRANEIDLMIAIIKKMASECVARRCPLVVMKFGSYISPGAALFQSVDRRLAAALTAQSGIHYLDLDEQFFARALNYDKLCRGNRQTHWNALGHHEAALLLHRFLVEHKLLETRR